MISRGLHVVDALLLMLCVWEVQNFELWEREGSQGSPSTGSCGQGGTGLLLGSNSQVDHNMGVGRPILYQSNCVLVVCS